MNFAQAEERIVQSVSWPMQSRALDMFRTLADSRTAIDALRIPSNWPTGGDITFKRLADGKRVWIGLRGQRFQGAAK